MFNIERKEPLREETIAMFNIESMLSSIIEEILDQFNQEEQDTNDIDFKRVYYDKQNKKSIYYSQTNKRYDNKRSNLENKYIYMAEIFNGLVNAIEYLDYSVNYYSDYLDYIDSAKEIIDDLIERLTKEIDQENIYNINSQSGLELLEELNILNNDYLIYLNTETELLEKDIILLCKQKAESIIKDFIDEKNNKYRNNKSKKYIKQKKEKDPNYLSLRERQNLMNELKENGYSNSEIANMLNITRQGVYKHFNKLKK